MRYQEYLKKVGENCRQAVKVEWLNPDETVNYEFTNSIYDMKVNLNVSYKKGSRRSCSITLNNDRNKFPIKFENIWIGQKFKLWMGIYIDNETPYYFPQGVFYISNPEEIYNPDERTVTIQGVDKWSYLDGSLFGRLTGTYKTNINDDLCSTIRKILTFSRYENDFTETTILENMIDPVAPLISQNILTKKVETYRRDTETGEFVIDDDGNYTTVTVEAKNCPYTVITERGKTFADILLEYANILCANIYYDVSGHLVVEPIIDNADDITDTDKEILWNYSVNEKTFLGLTQEYKFDQIHNDFLILGNIVNGYQFKARVQNRNILSDTCVQKIGLRPAEPIEDNQYYSDDQCKELALYNAKTETILQKSGNISSVNLYHLDVNKLVTISTPNNNMSRELFLVTGFSLSSSPTTSINVTSINMLNNFEVVEG